MRQSGTRGRSETSCSRETATTSVCSSYFRSCLVYKEPVLGTLPKDLAAIRDFLRRGTRCAIDRVAREDEHEYSSPEGIVPKMRCPFRRVIASSCSDFLAGLVSRSSSSRAYLSSGEISR